MLPDPETWNMEHGTWILLFLLVSCTSPSTDDIREALDPQVASWLSESRQALQQGNFNRAQALADSAAQYEPDFADVYFLKGEILLTGHRPEEARVAFERVLTLDPSYPGARQRLGDVAFQQNNLDLGLQYFAEEAETNPSASLLEQIGKLHAGAGNADAARQAYSRALEMDNTRASTHLLYGQLLEQLGELEQALSQSQKALALDPGNPNYQFATGAQLFQLGRLDEAEAYLRSAANAQLLHYPAQYNLANLLLRKNEEAEAQTYFARADTARILMDQINQVEEAISRNPGQSTYWNQLGLLYEKAEMNPRAVNAFTTALQLDPLDIIAQHALARAALQNNNTSEAIRRYKLMLVADNGSVEAWLGLAEAQARNGDCEEARASWQKAAQRAAGNSTPPLSTTCN